MKAKISEIFDSIQGEGLYQGMRQLFIRFYGCNLNCKFCDTKPEIYQEYTINALLTKLDEFKGGFHSFSFTGGEPLLQADFLKKLIPTLKSKKKNCKIYLETNGTLPEELKKILNHLEIIAMDIKLPSSAGSKNYWQEHARFLKLACERELFVKTVICNSTDLGDFRMALELLNSIRREIPLVLQPNYFEIGYSLGKKIEEFKRMSLEYLSDVRVLPQLHKILEVK